jgi:hypothetical protein
VGLLFLLLPRFHYFVRPSRIKFTILGLTLVSVFGVLGDYTPIGKAAYSMLPAFIAGTLLSDILDARTFPVCGFARCVRTSVPPIPPTLGVGDRSAGCGGPDLVWFCSRK